MPLPFSLKPWPSDCHPRLAVKYRLADSRLDGLPLQEYHEVGNTDVRLLAQLHDNLFRCHGCLDSFLKNRYIACFIASK